MPGISDMLDMCIQAVTYGFQIQASFWDEFGVFPTFMLLFVAITFFRYIILRMYGAGAAGVSDSIRAASKKGKSK